MKTKNKRIYPVIKEVKLSDSLSVYDVTLGNVTFNSMDFCNAMKIYSDLKNTCDLALDVYIK